MAKKVNNTKSAATKSATAKKSVKSAATKKSASTKRASAAKKAGVDLGNFFSMAQAEGATVKIVNGKAVLVGKDGNVIPSKTKTTTRTKTVTTTKVEILPADVVSAGAAAPSADRIASRIIDEGHIENASIHRRWVMAQTFRMLRHRDGWLAALRALGYGYMWHMLMEECKAIAAMERNNSTQAVARKRCFPLSSIHCIATDCIEKLGRHGANALHNALQELSLAETYAEAYAALQDVQRHRGGRWFNRLAMPTEFINCYKAAGAYYTMQNMVMFHGCFVHQGGQVLDQYASLDAIEQKAANCCAVGEGYKLFGMLKQLIADNGFDFQARMAEVYANR